MELDPTRLSPTTEPRPPYRPPEGVPLERQSRWATPISLALHVLLVLALLVPSLIATNVIDVPVGGGGPGARGGGGGGRNGTGGGDHLQERLRYVDVAPMVDTPAPEIVPAVIPPPVVTPPPKLEVKATPQPEAPKLDLKVDSLRAELPVGVAGTGGGTGNDGTNGTGPGSGGGVGSGVGTGNGSGTGPGTGGGVGSLHDPEATFLPLPPSPIPAKLKGQAITLRFLVNERGEVLKLEFDDTGDGSYNRRIREQFNAVRFRPAVKPDGTPVVAAAKMTLHM